MEKAKIYNISANYHFFESFLAFLRQNFDKNEEFLVFFASKRACREFEQISVEFKNIKIKAISEISFEDFLYLFDEKDIFEEIAILKNAKKLSNFDYLFSLSEEILKSDVFGCDIDFSYAMNLASSLKNIFDEIEKQEIDVKKIFEIDDSNLASHQQFNLQFLQKFYLQFENNFVENGLLSEAKFLNLISDLFVKISGKNKFKKRVVVAGSTGSVNFGKKIISSIAKQENSFVIFWGFEKNWKFFNDQKDAQFILNDLLNFCEIKKENIEEIVFDEFKLSEKSRFDFVLMSLLESAQTHLWNEFEIDEKTRQDLQENLQYFRAKNEIEEAKFVAKKAFDAALNLQKTAIIVNDEKFGKLIKNYLKNLQVEFNDARSQNLSDSNFANFILLILQLINDDFDSVVLLSLLKNPLCKYCRDFENLQKFEVEILRCQRRFLGLDGIKDALKENSFFDDFLNDLRPLLQNFKGFYGLIEVFENLSGLDFFELLEKQDCAEELKRVFCAILPSSVIVGKLDSGFRQNDGRGGDDFDEICDDNIFSSLKKSEMLDFFKQIFSQISYFQKSDSKALIQILSPIEARLLNFDLIIISSLCDGIFPEIEAQNWLGKKIRQDLQIDLSDKKIGQNSYDFCNYLANKKVILTNSATISQSLAAPSSFVLRLGILCKKFDISIEVLQENLSKNNPQKNDEIFEIKIPKRLSITDISKLISDPYQIYARKILQLKELDKIDYEPGYREFGSFVHEALEVFVKDGFEVENFLKKAQKIFDKYFINENSKIIWFAKFENIFYNFIQENAEIKFVKNFVEVPVKSMFEGFEIVGKIDRIILNENDEIEIFDYKTGQIPSIKNVVNGLEPQLTIAALMLEIDAFEVLKNKKITNASYIKLSASKDLEIKKIAKNDEEMQIIISAAKSGLSRLLSIFDTEKFIYQKSKFSSKDKNEYSHLKREF